MCRNICETRKKTKHFKPHVTIGLKDMKKYNFGRLCNSDMSNIFIFYQSFLHFIFTFNCKKSRLTSGEPMN